MCFPAHEKLNLILYTITNVPILDTWYCFVCLCYNQTVVQRVLALVTYGVRVSAIRIDLSRCVLRTVAVIFSLP